MKLNPGDILLWTVVAALGSVGLTVLIRNAPWVRGQVQAAKKPWACNVCMPVYTVAVMVAAGVWSTGHWSYLVAYPAAYGLGYLILEQMSRPRGDPPPLNLPEDSS